jgi:TRAP-type C4-dicarboxylate transport system permease small subunit
VIQENNVMNTSNYKTHPFIQKIEQAAELAAAFLTIFAAAIIFLGVILRNLFKTSPSWISELPTYAFTWAVFLALMAAFSSGPQLGLDMLVRRFSKGLQKAVYYFSAIVILAISLILIWLGSVLTYQQFLSAAVSNTALRFPLWIVSLALPIGFLLMAVHACVRILNSPALEDRS